ncbi:hypothetical protein EMGBS15_16370 [Filimonas sp.]|nr:hypothetical protein EMGBS15_16370 [Filimonas sp.]
MPFIHFFPEILFSSYFRLMYRMYRIGIIFCLLHISLLAYSQNKQESLKNRGILSGKVTDEKENPLELATVAVKGLPGGTKTDDKGNFSLEIPADKNIQIVFSSIGFVTKTITKRLAAGETFSVTIILKASTKTFKDVTIRDTKKRNQAGNVAINYKMHDLLPSTVGGIEGLLKVFLSNNNELTSQYNVRGGNFDENLVYINDFEVYRPFLVRSGQQEGLSIINPDLVGGVNFRPVVSRLNMAIR